MIVKVLRPVRRFIFRIRAMMNPSDIEFLAETEIVKIIPNFSHGKLHFIRGDCGPFMPSIPVEVPLWLAINLRQRQKCRFIPPDWMTVEKLEEKKQEEIDSHFFTSMPSLHYREFAQLLFDVAISDVPNADEVQTLIKDIWDVRMSKLRLSMDAFIKSDASHAEVNNLTMFEFNFVRSLLTASLYHVQNFKQVSALSQATNSQNLSNSI